MYVISLQTTQSISSLWPKSFVFNSDFSTTFFGFFSGEISVYGTRWTSHSPFDYFTESDNHWFRFNQLSPVHAEMESRHRSHARPVQGDWQRTLHDGECGLVWSGRSMFPLFSISAVQHSNVLHEIANDSDIRNRYGRKEKFHFKISK